MTAALAPYDYILHSYNSPAAFQTVLQVRQGMGDLLHVPTIYAPTIYAVKYYNTGDITVADI